MMKGNSIKKRSEKEQLNKESVRQDRDRVGEKGEVLWVFVKES